jgi:hypothetical protein
MNDEVYEVFPEAMNGNSLRDGEKHPSWLLALEYLETLGNDKILFYMSAFEVAGIKGNRAAQVCGEELTRYLNGEQLNDRELLGLVWFIRMSEEHDGNCEGG